MMMVLFGAVVVVVVVVMAVPTKIEFVFGKDCFVSVTFVKTQWKVGNGLRSQWNPKIHHGGCRGTGGGRISRRLG